jgi:hypothetical protein
VTHEQLRRAEDRDLARYTKQIQQAVAGKIADAGAHASKALTDTLDATAEGRPTAAKVRRSASYQAAISRLDELLDSLVKIVESCRVDTYAQAYGFWFDYHAHKMRRGSDSTPPRPLVERCRTTMIHGYTVRRFLQGPLDRASTQLLPTLTVAGNRAVSTRDAKDSIRRWQETNASAIMKNAVAAVIDSQTMSDRRAGRDTIKRELLHDDPQLND